MQGLPAPPGGGRPLLRLSEGHEAAGPTSFPEYPPPPPRPFPLEGVDERYRMQYDIPGHKSTAMMCDELVRTPKIPRNGGPDVARRAPEEGQGGVVLLQYIREELRALLGLLVSSDYPGAVLLPPLPCSSQLAPIPVLPHCCARIRSAAGR